LREHRFDLFFPARTLGLNIYPMQVLCRKTCWLTSYL